DLTLYALGALEGRERDALHAHLSQCATCRRELRHLFGDMGLLGLVAMGPAPPPRARARLLSAVAKEPRVRMVRKQARPWWLLAPMVAAIVLAVVSIVLSRQNSALRRELARQQAQSGQNQAEVERAREVLALLTAPDTMRVTLVASNAKPQPQGKAI